MSSVSDAATVALAGAATVAGVALWKNRDKIGKFFADTGDNITNVYNYTVTQAKEGAAAAGSALSQNFTPIADAATTNLNQVADNIKTTVSNLQSGNIIGAITDLFKANITTPKTIVESNVKAVKDFSENAYNSVKTGIDTVVGWFKR